MLCSKTPSHTDAAAAGKLPNETGCEYPRVTDRPEGPALASRHGSPFRRAGAVPVARRQRRVGYGIGATTQILVFPLCRLSATFLEIQYGGNLHHGFSCGYLIRQMFEAIRAESI